MNWKETIEAAQERGYFTEEERVAAGSWLSCAVGEHREEIGYELNPLMTPGAREIYDLGFRFSEEVNADHINAAENTYHLIQAAVEKFLAVFATP